MVTVRSRHLANCFGRFTETIFIWNSVFLVIDELTVGSLHRWGEINDMTLTAKDH